METRTSVTVRPVRDDDDLDALNAGSATWMGGATQRRLFAVDDATPKAMVVAEVDGVPAGYAHAIGHGIIDGHRGLGYVYVLPAQRRQGAGTALWDVVTSVCTPDRVRGIGVQVNDEDPTTLGIAVAHGFSVGGLHLQSELDLTTFDPPAELAEPRTRGVEVAPMPADADESDWRGFHAAFRRLFADAPDVRDGAEEMPFEVMRVLVPEPWQVMGAWKDGGLVGLTSVSVRGNPADRRVNTMLTAVDRDHRSLGLATALKVRHARALRDAGWRTVVTQNMEGNEHILASNRRLGFRPAGGRRDVVWDHV